MRNDNSKMQTSEAWNKILRKYNIAEENTEPKNPQWNPAEHKFKMSSAILRGFWTELGLLGTFGSSVCAMW